MRRQRRLGDGGQEEEEAESFKVMSGVFSDDLSIINGFLFERFGRLKQNLKNEVPEPSQGILEVPDPMLSPTRSKEWCGHTPLRVCVWREGGTEQGPLMAPPAVPSPDWGCGVSGSSCWRLWHNMATGSVGSAGALDRTAVSNGVQNSRRHGSEST